MQLRSMQDRDRRVVWSASVGLAQRVAQALTALITLPLALHVLGVAGFGIWGAATSLTSLVTVIDLGLGSALVTLLPRALASGATAAARRHVAAALLGATSLGLTLLALCAGGVLWRGWHGGIAPFLVAGIGLAVNLPLGIAQSLWFGLQKGYIAGGWELVQTALTLGLLLLAAMLGGGVLALVAAVYGAMVLASAGSLAHLLLTHPGLRPQAGRPFAPALWTVLAPGSLLCGIGLAGVCGYVFDNILALEWLGPAAAAQMAVAMRVCLTATGLLMVLSQPLWPAFVDAAARNDRGWEWRTLRGGTLVLTACALAGAGVIVVFGAAILRRWLHADLHLPPLLFWAMGAWIVVMNVPRVAVLLLNAVSVLWFQLAAVTIASIAALALKYLLARHAGAAGILIASPCVWLALIWPSYTLRIRGWLSRPRRAALPV